MVEIHLNRDQDICNRDLLLQHRQLKFQDHASLTFTRHVSKTKSCLIHSFQPSARQTALHFILNGQVSFNQNGNTPAAQIQGDKCQLMLIQPYQTTQCIQAQRDFMMASFYIDLDYFISVVNVALEALPQKFQTAIYKNVCSCNNYSWMPQAYYLVSQILSFEKPQFDSRIFLESKMLELISLLLEGEKCDYYSNITISGSDLDKIRYAHDILVSDLAHTPSLNELARQIGTNEFIVKKGFRQCYGKPVYQYVMQKRMELAVRYLMDTDLPISAIALCVGYEDPSAFSRAFKKTFQFQPNMVRYPKDLQNKYSVSAYSE
ncbi:MAG: helix-turn-helix transcriptional regulator [Saprospiraceae bacterium]|nr:helix-turn-helix transcriptional regulator [Saprospiraceae bacterium]